MTTMHTIKKLPCANQETRSAELLLEFNIFSFLYIDQQLGPELAPVHQARVPEAHMGDVHRLGGRHQRGMDRVRGLVSGRLWPPRDFASRGASPRLRRHRRAASPSTVHLATQHTRAIAKSGAHGRRICSDEQRRHARHRGSHLRAHP
jgi:hypothetical protein